MSGGVTILHVDDEPSMRDLTETFLERDDDQTRLPRPDHCRLEQGVGVTAWRPLAGHMRSERLTLR